MVSTFTALDASQYEQMMGRWSQILARQFIAFADVRDHDKVLDVGCGTGSLTLELLAAAKYLAVEAIDYSPVYLAAAKAKPGLEAVTFTQADVGNLPQADASFDRALSLLVLQFVPDTAGALAQMRRVVRPGGVVAAAVWDMRGGIPMQRIFWDTAACLSPGGEAARARAFSRPLTGPGELRTAFEAAGLLDVVDTALVMRMDYGSCDDFWEPIAAGEGPMGAFLGQLEAEDKSRLTDAVRRAYLGGGLDGPRSFVASAWACRGTTPIS